MPDERVRDSFNRCEAAGDFAEQFYDILLASSEEVATLFAATDFTKQRRLLRASVYIMVTRDVEDARAHEALERIGASHGHGQLNIRPEFYEVWLDSLCSTVAEMDPDWSESLEQSWRSQLRPGIDLITSLY